jgi:hypothetical protein
MYRIKDTDWLSLFLCCAVGSGFVTFTETGSENLVATLQDKLHRAYARNKIDAIVTLTTSMTKAHAGTGLLSCLKTTKPATPTYYVELDSDGILQTIIIGPYVPIYEGRVLDLQFNEDILSMGPQEVYNRLLDLHNDCLYRRDRRLRV